MGEAKSEASELSAVLERLWNAQADGFNQWRDLGEDEKVEFAAAVEREACAKACEEAMEMKAEERRAEHEAEMRADAFGS